MSKRKAHNMNARMSRACGAILRSNHVAVVNIDPSHRQGMVNWKNCKNVPPSKRVADAVCDYAHPWTIYLSGFCIDQSGQRYYKSNEVAVQGVYKAEHLEDVIDTTYKALIGTCNPEHLIGSGWIAIPDSVSLTEEQAAMVFEAVGAWDQKAAA